MMSTQEHWFPSHLTEIDAEECRELLRAHEVGRIAYCDSRGPVVLPVNYAVEGEEIWIEVSPSSVLGCRLQDAPCSLELDDFDSYNQTGWSVLVRGVATYAERWDLPADERRPFPWAEGRSLFIKITPEQVSGRRLLAA